MESPYVVAWDNYASRLVIPVHWGCARVPHYKIIRPLEEEFDYENCWCAICKMGLWEAGPQPQEITLLRKILPEPAEIATLVWTPEPAPPVRETKSEEPRPEIEEFKLPVLKISPEEPRPQAAEPTRLAPEIESEWVPISGWVSPISESLEPGWTATVQPAKGHTPKRPRAKKGRPLPSVVQAKIKGKLVLAHRGCVRMKQVRLIETSKPSSACALCRKPF